MADARSKAVLGELADLSSRSNYVIDKISNLRAPLGFGDIIEVPSISALTVGASGASDVSAQTITTSVLSLNANIHPMINMEIPRVEATQLMDGRWPAQVAMQAMMQLKNNMDNALCRDYLAQSLCWQTGTSSDYHFNEASDSLTEDDILSAKAYLLSNDGVMAQNLALFVSSYAEGSIMSIAGFVPNGALAEQGNLGIPRLGTVFGIPVYATNSILRNHSVATTAVSVTSNVATATVAAGHGFFPGARITNAGFTDSGTNTGTVSVTSTTSTTVVFPYTAGDGAQADGVGTITDTSSWNLLADVSQLFAAQQLVPYARVVPNPLRTSDNLQISSLWGRIGRAGRVVCIHSPGSSV